MSTSGVTSYQLVQTDIINAALRKLGALADGQTATPTQTANAAMALNMLIAEFRSMGMPLWARLSFSFSPIAGKSVYTIGLGTYDFNQVFPLHVLQAYRQDSGNATKVQIDVTPNFDFNLFPTNSGGTPIRLSYQPFINYGQISVWPTPDANAASQTTLTIVYHSPFQYFINSTDTMAFPEEWYNAVVYSLAMNLAPEYTLPIADRELLIKQAQEHVDRAKENGAEDGSLFVTATRRQ